MNNDKPKSRPEAGRAKIPVQRPVSLDVSTKHLFWLLMSVDIYQYLSACTCDKHDGELKAHCHNNLCATVIAGYKKCNQDESFEYVDETTRIHFETRRMTDNMDVWIDFPLNDENPDYDVLAKDFFEQFMKLSHLAMEG